MPSEPHLTPARFSRTRPPHTSTLTPPHPTFPLQIASNKRYAGNVEWTVSEVAARVAKDVGKIDVLVGGAVGLTAVAFEFECSCFGGGLVLRVGCGLLC